jgi:hypothetical protein
MAKLMKLQAMAKALTTSKIASIADSLMISIFLESKHLQLKFSGERLEMNPNLTCQELLMVMPELIHSRIPGTLASMTLMTLMGGHQVTQTLTQKMCPVESAASTVVIPSDDTLELLRPVGPVVYPRDVLVLRTHQ